MVSENASFYEHVPPRVINLTYGPEDDFIFLLDMELGILHWVDAGGKIRSDPSREPISDDAYTRPICGAETPLPGPFPTSLSFSRISTGGCTLCL